MSDKRFKMDNFEQCEHNIRKYNNPAGGDPDYWRDKYEPKKHSKTYLKNKYKPKLHSQKYYKDKYDESGKPKPKRKTKKEDNSQSGGYTGLQGADLWLIISALVIYLLYDYVFK